MNSLDKLTQQVRELEKQVEELEELVQAVKTGHERLVDLFVTPTRGGDDV